MKPILDACCGSKMFWFNKENTNVEFMDNRTAEETLCDGRELVISPDTVADFRQIPFKSNTFRLVVFDPPHLIKAGDKSWLAKKYGKLGTNWKDDLIKGFCECMRVLKNEGVLIFKWNEEQIKLSEIKPLFPCEPLFGNRRSKTHWIVFMKLKGE
jgi:tRNA G10  N-methylase Trm11